MTPVALQPSVQRQAPLLRKRMPTIPKLLPSLATAAFIALHAPLGILLNQTPVLTTVHALITVAVGMFAAVTRRLSWVAYVAAYITGAEVLWRMTHAAIFWETGKIGVGLICVAALVFSRRIRYMPLMPIIWSSPCS